ncbi:MAG: NAD-dependent epimerase/dehydratase family protein [Candidatus Acididesulfobacter diazotrophicus]|jgi:NADH dehydrogenase|uniref:NAD-dependent epimerase/dehydratase family protein n=1 Tax=Candidatus Acididesulfobacter diazotrophicus TaxID=2597226 RepID=A0A519BNE6_9DELT|nr:MAG: NAD-dependent epimerase/dehydratase family protein [Candidatus Acididesulfobacter diazotrophicus]
MKVFITGGTGFVGSIVASEIKKSGASVVLLERNKKKALNLKQEGFDVFEGSLENIKPLNDFFSENKFDAIINLIGIIKSQPDFSFQKVHVEYVKILLELAKSHDIKRFVHMSVNGASAESESVYDKSKYAGQKLVEYSGLDWTIFKPSLIFGDDAAFFDDLIKLIKGSLFVPIIGTGEDKFAPIDVMSIAKSFSGSLYSEASYNKIYTICGPDIYSFEGIIDLIMEIIPPKKIKIHAPIFIAEKGIEFIEKFFKVKGLPITSDQIKMLKYDNICENDMKEIDDLFKLNRIHLKDWLVNYLEK